MSETFVKLTEETGAVVEGDNNKTWIPINSSTFDQVLAENAEADETTGNQEGALTLALPTGEVDKALQSLLFSGMEFSTIEVATYGADGAPADDLSDDYTFSPDYLTLAAFNGPTSAQSFSFSYTSYQDTTTAYDQNGDVTGTTVTGRNLQTGSVDTTTNPTAPGRDTAPAINAPGDYPGQLTYEFRLYGADGAVSEDSSGSAWFTANSFTYGFTNRSIEDRNTQSSNPNEQTVSLSVTADAPNEALIDLLENGPGSKSQMEFAGFSAAGKLIDDVAFPSVAPSSVEISGDGTDQFSYQFVSSSYGSTEYSLTTTQSTTSRYDFATESENVTLSETPLKENSAEPNADVDNGGHAYVVDATAPGKTSEFEAPAAQFIFGIAEPVSGSVIGDNTTFDPLTITFSPGSLTPADQSELAVLTTPNNNLASLILSDYAAGSPNAEYTYNFSDVMTTQASPDTNGDGGGTYTFDYHSVSVSQEPACFWRGTRILTDKGEVPVESLQRGDIVLTNDGRAVPVCWVGVQTVSTRFADLLRVLPVRIKAGALAEDVPSRDLLLSTDHAILIEDVLYQAGALVNGSSVVRETDVPEVICYYHVETSNHSLILAENTPAETFVDNIDRLHFDNWAEYEALYPDGKPIEELPYPRAKSHRQVPMNVRIRLAARAMAVAGSRPAAA